MYWRKIGSIKNGSGQLEYPQLFSLGKCVLSNSHDNSLPETAFSINKHLLDIHGNSTKDDAVIALRMVKDHMASVGGIMNVSINKQLLSSVKSIRQRYESELKTNRQISEKLPLEKYCSCDKACQFSALWGTP